MKLNYKWQKGLTPEEFRTHFTDESFQNMFSGSGYFSVDLDDCRDKIDAYLCGDMSSVVAEFILALQTYNYTDKLWMQIYDNKDKGFITVWMTNEEQKQYNLSEITNQLLQSAESPKCKVVFFLSGHEDLFYSTEGLLLANLKNV